MYMEMGVYRHQWSMTTRLISFGYYDPLPIVRPEESTDFTDFQMTL